MTLRPQKPLEPRSPHAGCLSEIKVELNRWGGGVVRRGNDLPPSPSSDACSLALRFCIALPLVDLGAFALGIRTHSPVQRACACTGETRDRGQETAEHSPDSEVCIWGPSPVRTLYRYGRSDSTQSRLLEAFKESNIITRRS